MPKTRPQPTPFSRFRLDFSPLRKRRREIEMSQRALARAVGVHTTTIYRLETNRHKPTLESMVTISRALGTPTHLLYFVLDPEADGR